MSNGSITDFGSVYRAALAERDPEKKLALLRDVQETLLTWRIADENMTGPPSKRAAKSASSLPTASQQVSS